MPHFRLNSTEHIVAGSARDAIHTDLAIGAAANAELADEEGTVIARKLRVEFDGGWIVAWVATEAWPDLEPPINLESLLDDDEGGGSAS